MDEITVKFTENKELKFFKKNHATPLELKISTNGKKPATELTPKELLLCSLASCTALDISALLAKMRVEIKNFEITVCATISNTSPLIYTRFNVNYCFEIEGLPLFETKNKLKKIVELSQERYCTLSQMLKKVAPIKYKITINGNNIETCACKL